MRRRELERGERSGGVLFSIQHTHVINSQKSEDARTRVRVEDVGSLIYPDRFYQVNQQNLDERTHAKLGVDSAVDPQWFCVGDVNRGRCTGYTRGGGAVSLHMKEEEEEEEGKKLGKGNRKMIQLWERGERVPKDHQWPTPDQHYFVVLVLFVLVHTGSGLVDWFWVFGWSTKLEPTKTHLEP